MTAESDTFFRNRFVVLTGVGRKGQTGEVIAREFARRGATMLLVDRTGVESAARTDELRSEGLAAHPFSADLSSESDTARLASEITAHCGDRGLVALVNAAGGFAMSGNVADSSFDVWQKQLSINLATCYLTTRALLPLLRREKGTVINFATGAAAANQGAPGMSAYLAAKSGVVALTRTIAQEERENGVRVNAVAPSAIRTAANLESMGPGARYVEREEVAATIIFLCSPAASAVNGEIIRLV